MRLVGTVIVCAALAFGAAFLIGRAVDHHGSSEPHRPASTRSTTTASAELASEFVPGLTTVKLRAVVGDSVRHHRAKPHRRSKRVNSSAGASSNTGSAASVTANTQPAAPAPTYTPAAAQPSRSSSASGGSGSGTTSVGGSGKKSGSGTTSVG